MGTSAQPEASTESQPNSQQQENATGQQTTENQEQASQQTPAESRAERLLSLYEQQMRESHRIAVDAQNRLEQYERNQQAAIRDEPPAVPDINATEFWNKPLPHIAQIIRDETRKAVQPLYEFKQQFENANKYDSLKNRFKNDPRYSEIFPKIEGIVDQLMQGQEANDNMMNATILSAIGALHTGQIPGQTLEQPANKQTQQDTTTQQNGQQTQQTNRGNAPVMTPAHLRPSATGQNTGDANKKKEVRQLTELESRIARENHMSPEEYVSWIEEDSTKVAVSQIGKKPPEQPNNSQVVRGTQSNQGAR